MNTNILTTILLLFSFGSFGQELQFKIKEIKTIQETYDPNNRGATIHEVILNVQRLGSEIPAFGVPIKVKATHITTSPSDFTILNPSFTISKNDFNVKGNNFDIVIYISVSKDNESVDFGDEMFTIGIVPNLEAVTSAFMTAGAPNIKVGPDFNITIKDAPKDTLLFDPFRITVGANFDFEKSVSTSFFFDAQAFCPNLWYGKNKTSGFGLGFYGSLYNNKYISQDSIQIYGDPYYEAIGNGDTVNLLKYNYQIGISNSIKNIGAEGGLIWGWETKINPDVYVANTFILPEISAIHRRITSTYSYKKTQVDTLFNVPMPDSLRGLVERDFINRSNHEVLLGLGYIGRFHSKKHGEFMLKITTGGAFQKSSYVQTVKAYYSFRFQLLDPKVGINLGGEVRGYYGSPSPYFGVYLSKSFGLKKLTEY